MRPQTHYLKKHIPTGTVECLAFTAEDYSALGLAYASLAGIPQLEAFTLVNQWNIQQDNQRFMFALAGS